MERRHHRVVIVGEVLFDAFPDGDRLGGAPFNFAWHLQGLGFAPRFVSRIGEDPHGARIRDAMAAHGMTHDGVQRDPDHPTGVVRVELDGSGGHRFEIVPNQAYDHLAAPPVSAAARDADLFYFGTLATRAPESREAILGAAAAAPAVRFLDVNLRPRCWNATTVTACLEQATVAKLNDDELTVLRDLFALPDGAAVGCRGLAERFDLHTVILTRGARGALWLDGSGVVERPAPTTTIVDTVGAGDGFAAVAAVGLLQGWSPPTTLERATAFAARICAQRGACPDDPGFYVTVRQEWGREDAL
jgi:fructokinase